MARTVEDTPLAQLPPGRLIALAAELGELLAKSPGVAVSGAAMPPPSIREAAESEVVLVGRIRRDPSCERGLLFWLAADPVRLAASNAVRLAEIRFHIG